MLGSPACLRITKWDKWVYWAKVTGLMYFVEKDLNLCVKGKKLVTWGAVTNGKYPLICDAFTDNLFSMLTYRSRSFKMKLLAFFLFFFIWSALAGCFEAVKSALAGQLICSCCGFGASLCRCQSLDDGVEQIVIHLIKLNYFHRRAPFLFGNREQHKQKIIPEFAMLIEIQS